ncbi:Uncharacterised protein [Bordetella trematum]|nr:Uncharacterised protein [Bordetella trematum]VDH06605.1 Uncharacterised protein [Bordetella trematum]
MKPKNWPQMRLLMVCAPILAACAPAQTRWLVPQPIETPPLPTEARQGPPVPICLPTCSAGLAAELQSLHPLQTVHE